MSKNIMTFNPGWDKNGNMLDAFTDVRNLQREIKARRYKKLSLKPMRVRLDLRSFIVIDPDGNPILIDQHV